MATAWSWAARYWCFGCEIESVGSGEFGGENENWE